MKESKEPGLFPYELVTLAIFLSLLLVIAFFGDPSFMLSEIDKLYISQATLDGVDISKRVNLFYQVASLLGLSTLILIFLFRKLIHRFDIKESELKMLSVPSLIGIFLLMADAMGKESSIGVYWALGILLYISVVLILNRNYLQYDSEYLSSQIVLSLMLAMPLYVGITFLGFQQPPHPMVSLGLYFIGAALGFIMLLYASSREVSNRRILIYSGPILRIPIFIFIGVELFFLFKFRLDWDLHLQSIFICLVFLSILSAFRRYRFGRNTELSNVRLHQFFGLSALVSFLVFTIYFPIITPPQELFELANPANAQMRMFRFGELPLIDFMSSHMLSEQIPGIIYHLIHGFDGSLNFLIFEPLYIAGFFLIAFFWGLRVLGSTWASLLFLVAFPYLHSIYPTHLFYTLLAFAAIHFLLKKPNAFRWIVLGLVWICLIVWRLDAGVAALTAGLLYLVIQLYLTKTRLEVIPALKGVSALLGFVGLSIVFAISLRSPEYILQNFKTALHYVAGHQAHGYSLLAGSFDHQFYLLHLILPVLGVLAVVLLTIYIRQNREGLTKYSRYTLDSALFFYLIFLANFPRGIVRHGFIENHDKYLVSSFYLATVLVLLGLINIKSRSRRFAVFFSASTVIVLLIKVFPLSQSTSEIDKFFADPSVFTSGFMNDEINSRIVYGGDIDKAREELADYLGTNLNQNQTFLDFSNAPMLYFYSGRAVPSYFCQNLQNSIDDFTQIEHIKSLEEAEVPLVVYSHIPALWYDATDGVPNSMRYYLIAEYIYGNYAPFDRVGNRSIWKKRGVPKPGLLDSLYISEISKQVHDYRKGAIHLESYLESHPERSGPGIDLLKESNLIWNFPTKLVHEQGSFMRIKVKVPSEKKISFDLIGDGGPIGKIAFTAIPEQSNYLVRISNFYRWYHSTPLKTRFEDLDSAEVLKLTILPDAEQ